MERMNEVTDKWEKQRVQAEQSNPLVVENGIKEALLFFV